MTLLVHPDKNSGEKARQAFQLLNKAYKILIDDEERVCELCIYMVLTVLQNSVLKAACEVAKQEKAKQEGKATVDEIIKINAKKIQQKRKLSKAQVHCLLVNCHQLCCSCSMRISILRL